MPVFAAVRIIPSRWANENKLVPKELINPEQREQLISAVPEGDLCIVGPDDSNCIYFYFLEKKGGGFGERKPLQEQLNPEQTRIEKYISFGAKWVYSDDPSFLESPEVQPHLDELITEVGNFKVYRLK